MATKKNTRNRKFLLVALPAIVILLIVLLTLIQREEDTIEPETAEELETEVESLVIEVPEPETEHEAAGKNTAEPITRKGRMYLVIDDVGYNIQQLESFLQLEIPLTFAVLPFLPYSDEAAKIIEKEKKEYIIHMPMEPINGEDPGPGALFTSMGSEKLTEAAYAIIRSLPGAAGVNNHMGSRFTSDKKAMNTLLEVLKEEEIFYLDSYTTADSVVEELCDKNNLTYKKRDIFIDNTPETASMENALREGFMLAEKNGETVLIGHVWSENLPGVLDELYREGKKNGLQFGYLSELYKEEGSS